MTILVYPASLVAGTPENVNDLNSNLVAIAGVVNGNIDTSNLANASVTKAKLATDALNAFLKTASGGDYKFSVGNFTLGFSGVGAPTDSTPIAHGLGVVPARILITQRGSTADGVWGIAYARSKDATNFVARGVAAVATISPNFNIDFDFFALSG